MKMIKTGTSQTIKQWMDKIIKVFIFLVFVSGFTTHVPPAFATSWNVLKGDHFIVHHQGKGQRFAARVLKKAESYYDAVAKDLGYSRRSEFWLWENRCHLYLYQTKEAFHLATHQSEWSSGYAVPSKRKIVSHEEAEEFLDSVLPHEIAHLTFRDFVGMENNNIPLWLDEGVAIAQEEIQRKALDQLVKVAILEKKWIPFEEMAKFRTLSHLEANQAALFYAQAQSIVRYLLSYNESDRFIQFCRDLRDGKALQRALEKNYPKRFPSIEALEEKWVASHA